jgi:putative transposase
MDLKHTKHAVGQSAYHLVWKPKYSVSVFLHSFPREICEQAIRNAARKWKIEIIELKVMPDHVHCFVNLPTTMSVGLALQILKGCSAREVFKKCTKWRAFFSKDGKNEPHLWSPGKFFRSVGCVTAEVVESYIKNSQEEWKFDFEK